MAKEAATRFCYDFQSEILQTVPSNIQNCENFDVTLCCLESPSSNKWISVLGNSLLLSASSETIGEIIECNAYIQTSNTVINLVGVFEREVCYILKYICEGVVEVPESALVEFTKAANLLKIKVISDDNTKKQQNKIFPVSLYVPVYQQSSI